jgi:hypothetical protein
MPIALVPGTEKYSVNAKELDEAKVSDPRNTVFKMGVLFSIFSS